MKPYERPPLHAHMDQAGQDRVGHAAGHDLESAGGSSFVDLQLALADGGHLAEHGNYYAISPWEFHWERHNIIR